LALLAGVEATALRGVDQGPGSTNAIAGFDASLGARLLHRTMRNTILTDEGEDFHKRAAQLLADPQETRSLFGGLGQTSRGRRRIGLLVALAKPFIIPVYQNPCTAILKSVYSLASAVSLPAFSRRQSIVCLASTILPSAAWLAAA
jgi:hypothetical protein